MNLQNSGSTMPYWYAMCINQTHVYIQESCTNNHLVYNVTWNPSLEQHQCHSIHLCTHSENFFIWPAAAKYQPDGAPVKFLATSFSMDGLSSLKLLVPSSDYKQRQTENSQIIKSDCHPSGHKNFSDFFLTFQWPTATCKFPWPCLWSFEQMKS